LTRERIKKVARNGRKEASAIETIIASPRMSKTRPSSTRLRAARNEIFGDFLREEGGAGG
jgi:hypothetical protein